MTGARVTKNDPRIAQQHGWSCRVPVKPGAVCARTANWVVHYPGRFRKDRRRSHCRAPRCSEHAVVFAKRHGIRCPKALEQWITMRRGKLIMYRGAITETMRRIWERLPEGTRPDLDRLVRLADEEFRKIAVLG